MNQIHEENMKKALLEAKKAYDLKEVPIGCVIVDKNNKVIGKGHNTKETMANPLLHAEIIAIEQAVKVIKD
jgi:tRNA(adenine34) deaminase